MNETKNGEKQIASQQPTRELQLQAYIQARGERYADDWMTVMMNSSATYWQVRVSVHMKVKSVCRKSAKHEKPRDLTSETHKWEENEINYIL